MDNSVINAVKRLERAGSESSKATKKLVEAAGVLGDWVANLKGVPGGGEALPRGYWVEAIGSSYKLCRPSRHYDKCIYGDKWTEREEALWLAEDVARGWLDELAAWLEKRTAEAKNAETVLVSKGQPIFMPEEDDSDFGDHKTEAAMDAAVEAGYHEAEQQVADRKITEQG